MKGNDFMSRTQEKINQSYENVYAGIDVGKDHLDFYISPLNIQLQVGNDPSGIKKLTRLCLRHKVQMVALEATSKYHRLAHEMLHNPRLIKLMPPFSHDLQNL